MKDLNVAELKECAFEAQDQIQTIKKRIDKLFNCVSSIRNVEGLSVEQLDLVLSTEARIKAFEAEAFAFHEDMSDYLKAVDKAVAEEATRRR